MHLLKDGFVEEGLVFATIAPAAVSNFLHFGEQVFAFEKDVLSVMMKVRTLYIVGRRMIGL